MTGRWMQQLERFLFSCGLTCAVVFLALLVEREWFQYRYVRDLSRAVVWDTTSSPPKKKLRHADGEVLGKIEIARLGISAAVVDGEDERTLRRAVGHLTDTAYPGEAGRMVLAAHRDTFFRNLRWAKVGDVVRMETPRGGREYVVEAMMVVNPEEVDVIGATKRELLTLVTCYPFDSVGPAPYRFLVHAGARGAQWR
ncbi:MAG: class D sortase [Bryobacteraceae bacterium]